ncbi:hypothetical protein PCC7424_2097 [Gloeothece citriformis PCC 7424]|uniref:PepSY domain-containing protein n=1 Tax=Gloeothece citriformis (strain PCC 7424) TaxID=65393 RepID=B7KG53_GLOC7|nr:hypothetical protein [Gloeothece citriformis]ACK70524.1 hypothetical protein PCC7424_2097 [Gloeothece citriformis PCC 7424]
MNTKTTLLSIITILSTLGISSLTQAQTVNSRCDIYPRGEDRASNVVNCTFSQRQGFIRIQREDGISYELKPDGTNKYLDQNGVSVVRENEGPATIFRFSDESVYVYQNERAPASTTKKGETPENLYSTVPPALKDLVGARAGQAEGELQRRGYTYRNTQTFEGGKSAYYIENKSGYCVEVGTVDGRYSSIVYNSSDRCNPSN